jgi:nicotinamidase-related amidase
VFYAQADHRSDGRDHALAVTDIDLARNPSQAAGLGIASGAREAEVIDELAPQPQDYVIKKHRWSAFFQTELELSLRARGIDTLLVAGGSTEVGIGATAYAARDLDISTVVVRECMRSGRGAYVSDYCVNEVFPRLSRVRSVDQIIGALANGGQEENAPAPNTPPQGRSGSVSRVARPQLAIKNEPQLDPKRTGLVLFDTLKRYFYDESMSALLPETKNQLAACQRILATARKLRLPVFYPAADHREDGADWATAVPDATWDQMVERFGRLRVAPGLHHGGESAEVVPELAPEPSDYMVLKHRWSSFHGTHLELSLRTAGVDTILLAGGSTEIGIISTAYGARDRDFSLVILQDACRSARPGMDAFLMEHVFPRMARVRTVEQTIDLLAPSPSGRGLG